MSRRQVQFAMVGVAVAAFGTLLLVALVDLAGVNPHIAYLVQAVTAIELNFLLNWRITWRDRGVTGLATSVAWLKFHATRAFTVPFNQLLFSTLVVAGCNYLVANLACIGVIAALNFLAADRWAFQASDCRVGDGRSAQHQHRYSGQEQ